MKKNNKEFSFREFRAKTWYFLRNMSYARIILIIYLFITILGAVLLWLPISKTGNDWDSHLNHDSGGIVKKDIPFINSVFTAASAFSDTGLVTNTTAVSYTIFGQAVIAVLIFVGGIGFFALKVYIFNIIFGRNLGYRGREALAAERGSIRVGVSRQMIRVAVTILLVIIVAFSFILSAYFYYTDVSADVYNPNDLNPIHMNKLLHENPYHNSSVALRFGFFHTISAINNSGFDIMGGSSLTPYYHQYTIQILFFILFLIGGIGFPVIYDVFMWTKNKASGKRFKLSLFTKISMVAYFIVTILGLTTTFMLETLGNKKPFWDSNTVYGSKSDKTMALFFNTVSTRNAGFSTINLHDLSKSTLLQYSILMFIGSAPSSTAGGIRTTTIAIIVLSLWGRLRGRSSTYAFKKRIPGDTINRAFIVLFISVVLVLLSTLISTSSYKTHGGDVPTIESITQNHVDANGKISAAYIKQRNNHFTFIDLLFESSSAFGTTGLSTGLTGLVNTPSKISLILLMFIGQLGVSSSILIWGKKNNRDKNFKWIKHDVTIG